MNSLRYVKSKHAIDIVITKKHHFIAYARLKFNETELLNHKL